jgi:hypothetical protein
MKARLFDQSDIEYGRTVDVTVEEKNGTLLIKPEGYGDMVSEDGHGIPVVMELYQGRLRIIAWADINQEDYTDIIDLEEAREDSRTEIEEF